MYSLPLNSYTFQLGENPNSKGSLWGELKQIFYELKESLASFLWYAFKADLR